MHAEQIIKRPILLTEKAARLREDENKVIFEVDPRANKIQIKSAVESLFGVKVTAVNTSVVRGHFRRMGRGYGKLQNWKKAVVTLKAGDDIQFYDEESDE
ncbi:MAG: 50S ribosomal protein L23 [Myxococcales bacterium]|nr:50S ribosomal protein L23 [Myxococcales bacterium]